MMATTSPSRADSDTPFSTCSWPNFLCRFSMWIASAAPSRSVAPVAAALAGTAVGHLRCVGRVPLRARHHPVTLEPTRAGWTGAARIRQPRRCVLRPEAGKWLVAARQAFAEDKMNIQAGRTFGAQSMAAPLKRVLMRSAASAMRRADRARMALWPGLRRRARRPRSTALSPIWSPPSGAAIEWLPDDDDGLSDSVFTHDPSLMTDRGAIILSMGKALRRTEPALHEAAYRRLGIPVLGRIEAPGQVEGGDCVWVDAEHAGDRPRRAHQPVRHRADGANCWRRSASRCWATTCRCGWARRPACT